MENFNKEEVLVKTSVSINEELLKFLSTLEDEYCMSRDQILEKCILEYIEKEKGNKDRF